jgi:putative methylase
MRKKQLEIALQKLSTHPKPSARLEQYMTPGDVASTLLHLAYIRDDIVDKVVCDLGCGTGRLAIGAALLGAREVIGVDLDEAAIEVAEKNADKAGVSVKWVKSEVDEFCAKNIDTVIQNPPFGVQRRGADMKFLRKALELAKSVYSIHKVTPENREFIAARAEEMGGSVTDRIELEFHIPRQFEFHTRDAYRFKVDLYRIVRG